MKYYRYYDDGKVKAVIPKELIDMRSESVQFRHKLAKYHDIHPDNARFFLWDGKIHKSILDEKINNPILDEKINNPKKVPPQPPNPEPKPVPSPSTAKLEKTKIVMPYRGTITKPSSQPVPSQPVPSQPVPSQPTPAPAVERPKSKTCENPRIIKIIENGKETSFNGCDATMANCSAIFWKEDGTKREPAPNLKSYFYDTNELRPGCRLRCPGMIHDISKDIVDKATGEVSNYCSRPGGEGWA